MAERTHVIDISGDEAFLRGYIEGFFCGRGLDISGVHFGSDYGLENEGFLGKLGQLLGLHVERNVLLVSDRFLVLFDEAIARLPEAMRLRIDDRKTLRELRFPFQAVTYSRDDGAALKKLTHEVLAGVRIDELLVHERDKPAEERGAYTPEHAYKLEISGVLRGELEAVLSLHRQLARFDAVNFEHAEIEAEPEE